MLSADDEARWKKQGLLHLSGFFSAGDLDRWTNEIAAWPESPGKWMKYFESVGGNRTLCRIENFLEYHSEWEALIGDERLAAVLADLFGEPAVLFKEKINFKLPGGSGFAAHQDAPAFSTFGQDFHITAMVSIDAATVSNGCLEVATGRHDARLMEMTEAKTLSETVVKSLAWVPLETRPGDLVLFGSYLPHRSGINTSGTARRAAYLTFNGLGAGDCRAAYYQDKREVFPPDVERIPGRDYTDSGSYNIGNPIRE